MTFDKKPLQIRMTTENKKLCQQLGADVLRKVLELNIDDVYTRSNINIAILEDDLQDIEAKRNKLLEDVRYYENQIKRCENRVTEYNQLIQDLNKDIRTYYDKKQKESKEIKNIVEDILNILKLKIGASEKEAKIFEVINEADTQYHTHNEVIDCIIIELKKLNVPEDVINSIDLNCRLAK